ncbi:MAG: ABC transporter ATP-binding protein [Myxococcota bacterium]
MPLPPAVRAHGVTKSFVPGIPVLTGVDLRVERGEIHALLGENGAGKSTLMNVLIGLVRPDRGRLEFAGKPVALASYGPESAAARGVGMVHQHSALVPAMTVVENLAFGDPGGGFRFRPAAWRARAAELLQRFDLEVPIDRRVEELSVGSRQRAEILRALSRGATLLILDEPTAVLTPGETLHLFESLRRLRASGCAVIFISHKLDEVEAIADRVTVLRRGRVTATLGVGEAGARALGRFMLGRDLPPVLQRPRRQRRAVGAGLAIRGLSVPGVNASGGLRDVDLEVLAGEIVGVAGIDGNGQRELEEVLAGVRRPASGGVWVVGQPVRCDARALRRAGVAHLSGDRETAGLIRGFTVAENFILKGSYDDRRYFRSGWLDRGAARRAARSAALQFGVVPPDPDADIGVLSGGNAQKLVVARELEGAPPVLVAVNPTRGLDVGAARFVHERLLVRRDGGTAVLLISTELDEVLALADRTVALVRGEVHPVPPGSDRAALGALLLGEATA